MYDLVIIGGGPAGVTAALRARELGASVALVEKGRMGGTCTNDGCVPTRVLAKAARLVRDSAQFADYAIDGRVQGVDLEQLLARTQQIVYRMHEKKQLLTHLAEAGVEVLAEVGPARFVDAHSVALPDGRRLEAEQFIICAGGFARQLDFPGAELAMTHHDVWSLKRQPLEVAVVGAAATGCQLASIFSDFGSRVWLLESAPRILGSEDVVVSEAITAAFERDGIEVLTGIEGVKRLERAEGRLRLSYRHDGEARSVDVEAVIMAVGWVGYGASLNLAAARVQTERGFIVVNDYLQSSVPHIYAAGDINGRMMLVQSAGYEARLAVENALLGQQAGAGRHKIVPHGGFTDPEYGSVGLTEAEAQEVGAYAVATVPYADLDRAVIDGYTMGQCKLIVSPETRQLLGAHVVGEQAVEVVQLVATGMAAGMRVEQLAALELAYPTYTAIVGLAARRLVRQLGVIPLAREWHTLRRAAEWEQPSL